MENILEKINIYDTRYTLDNNYISEEKIQPKVIDVISNKTIYDVFESQTNKSEIKNIINNNWVNPLSNKSKPKKLIDKFFSNFSRYQMDYKDDIIRNMKAIPADIKLLPKSQLPYNSDIFSQLNSKWKEKKNEDKDFAEKDLQQKREILRKLAVQPELEDILDTMSNEAIVYDAENSFFVSPFIEEKVLKDIDKKVIENIKNDIDVNFYRFYRLLDWKKSGWEDFKRFLVEGILSWEIVYDSLENPKNIIGLIPVDPATLTKKYDSGKWYWIQFKGIQGRERKLLDAQIIYIQYAEPGIISRQSYLERLIRPYNIYRIIEQAQIIWTITNAQFKTKFTIPVQGMNTAMGAQTVSTAMNQYKEDIKFNSDMGELLVNGRPNMPFNKEYWLPETDSGSPDIEILGGEGPELSDNDQLKYFKLQLIRASKIPPTRFDTDSDASWFGTDAADTSREEINFGRFVTKLRNTFSQIIIKPLQIQTALNHPELKDAKSILDSIQLSYNSYNVFEELMEQDLMLKRVEFIQNMKDSLVDMDANGNDIKFFSSNFLVQKYLKLSEADLKLNEKYKEEERKEMEEINRENGEVLGTFGGE